MVESIAERVARELLTTPLSKHKDRIQAAIDEAVRAVREKCCDGQCENWITEAERIAISARDVGAPTSKP